jgi:hypothetical protein
MSCSLVVVCWNSDTCASSATAHSDEIEPAEWATSESPRPASQQTLSHPESQAAPFQKDRFLRGRLPTSDASSATATSPRLAFAIERDFAQLVCSSHRCQGGPRTDPRLAVTLRAPSRSSTTNWTSSGADQSEVVDLFEALLVGADELGEDAFELEPHANSELPLWKALTTPRLRDAKWTGSANNGFALLPPEPAVPRTLAAEDSDAVGSPSRVPTRATLGREWTRLYSPTRSLSDRVSPVNLATSSSSCRASISPDQASRSCRGSTGLGFSALQGATVTHTG